MTSLLELTKNYLKPDIMFQMLRFKEDPVTHSVNAMVEYEWKGGKMERKEKVLPNPESAWDWIEKERHLYIITKLRNYIFHKKELSEYSSLWSTPANRASKLRSLEIMLRETEIIATCKTQTIAIFIQRCYKHLANILPGEQHCTFSSQRQILNQLWEFACENNPNSGIEKTTVIE